MNYANIAPREEVVTNLVNMSPDEARDFLRGRSVGYVQDLKSDLKERSVHLQEQIELIRKEQIRVMTTLNIIGGML